MSFFSFISLVNLWWWFCFISAAEFDNINPQCNTQSAISVLVWWIFQITAQHSAGMWKSFEMLKITQGSGIICANSILGQGHQPRTLLQTVQSLCVSPSWPASALSLVFSLQLSLGNWIVNDNFRFLPRFHPHPCTYSESPWCYLMHIFTVLVSFYVSDEVTQVAVFPNCCLQHRLRSLLSDVTCTVLFSRRWNDACVMLRLVDLQYL